MLDGRPFQGHFCIIMARKDKRRILAEGMFIEQGMTGEAIAEMLDVRAATVSGWRKADDWDRRRDENLAAPHKLREVLMAELKRISAGEKPTIDADALSKVAKVMDTINDKITPQIAMSILKQFDNWMADQDPKTAVSFLEWHKKFLQHIIAQHG